MVLDNYEMEEEIALKYDIEVEKLNLIDKPNIHPKEIDKIKNKIEKHLFNMILEKTI